MPIDDALGELKVEPEEKKPKSKIILISTEIPKFYKKFGFKKINSRYDGNYLLMEKRLK